MKTWVMVAAALLAACGGDDDDGPELPPFEDVEVVYVVGDSATPAHAASFAALLAANDDDRFPEFAGADLASALPGVEVVRGERGGDSYHAGIALPAGDDRPALVIVQLGVNDVLSLFVKLALDPFAFTPEQMPITMDGLRQQVRALLAHFNEFPTAPLIVVVNPADPADGQGDLYDVALDFFPTLGLVSIDQELLDQVIAELDLILREEAAAAGALFVDANAHFRGHGYHAADADRWMQNLFELNARGAHELRRVIWNALVDPDLTGPIPALEVPPDQAELPAIPDNGWANALVDEAVTDEYLDPASERTYVNISADAMVAIGAPEGDDGEVALGIAGAYIVLDLGEGEEAADGPGVDLLVLENGAMSGGAPEPYRVWVATAPDGPFVPITDARGERAFDLAGTGIASARYVKVESQSYIPDVVGGLGSPLAPGPEIDAVGAVYPGGAGT